MRTPEIAPHVVALIRQLREAQPLLGKDAIAAQLKAQYGIAISASSVGRTIARHRFFFASTPAHEQKRASAPATPSFGASGDEPLPPLLPTEPIAS